MAIEKILRRSEVMVTGGYGDAHSTFDDDVRSGTHPPPDGYLGPKRPFWWESTIEKHQKTLRESPEKKRAIRHLVASAVAS
jgi:hypothetical protein